MLKTFTNLPILTFIPGSMRNRCMAEVMVATVRAQVLLSLLTDFEHFKTFKPSPQREKELNAMLDQLVAWGGALKTLRFEAAEEAALAGE